MIYPNLGAEMARNDVTQKDIAELLGKTPETICNWMNGKSGEIPVGAAMMLRATMFPDVPVEHLFYRKAS